MTEPQLNTLTEPQLLELEGDLHQLSDQLQAQLSQSRAASQPVDLDEPIGRLSRMDAMQQQKMVAATRGAAQLRKRQVEAALTRCKNDEYGDCASCGEAIGFPRLKAKPETALCLGCQKSREHSAG